MKKTTYQSLLIATSAVLMLSGSLFADGHSKASENPLNLKGDLRIRQQVESQDSTTSRSRSRIRFRLGGSNAVSEDTKVSFGLATGGTDPRSTNQTLQNSSQTPDIRLDYAYVTHKFPDQFTVMAGKMKNPLYRPSDLLWDSDINPDGLAVTFKSKDSKIDWSVIGGYFILDELSDDTKDPYLLAIQPSIDWKLDETTTARTTVSYYVSQNLEGNTLDNSASSNTLGTSGYDEDFATLVTSAQIDFKDVYGLELVRPFAEFVINTNKDDDNKGGIVGVKFGHKKVKEKCKWQSTISYRYLATDAWLDTFPDSDAYGGATNAEGLEVELKYGLSKHSSIGVDVYSMNKINGVKDAQTITQLDLIVKF